MPRYGFLLIVLLLAASTQPASAREAKPKLGPHAVPIMEIANAEKIGRSFVSRLLRLTLLAPDIQEAILEGRQARGMQLEELTRAMPAEWGEQRQSCFQP